MNTYELCDKLSAELTKDQLLIVGSSCMAIRIFKKHYTGKARMIESNKEQGSMGASLAVSFGLYHATGKVIVVVDGDGSLFHGMSTLMNIAQENLPITIYAIDNGGYASIRNSETRWFGRTSKQLDFPDIRTVALAYGKEINVIHAPHDEVPPPKEV